jgi:hypothetical protein
VRGEGYNRRLPDAVKWLLTLLLGLALCYGLLYVVYVGAYLGRLEGFGTNLRSYLQAPLRPDYTPLTGAQVYQLGWAQSLTASPTTVCTYAGQSYQTTDTAKTPGCTRIGLFGCSFVMGREAARGHDLASWLQRALDPDAHHTEIINFGVDGYGLGQTALLLQWLAPRYALDVAIVNLHDWHRDRDLTFQFQQLYLPIHSRWIVRQDSLVWLPLPVDSTAANPYDRLRIARRYHNLWQEPYFYRHDRKPPNVVRWFRSSFAGVYHIPLSDTAEMLALYPRLLDHMARYVPELRVVTNDSLTALLAHRTTAPNIRFYDGQNRNQTFSQDLEPVQRFSRGLHTAPAGHFSADGNRFRALRWLATGVVPRPAGTSVPALTYVRLRPLDPPAVAFPRGLDLTRARTASLELPTLRLDSLFAQTATDARWHWSRRLPLADGQTPAYLLLTVDHSDLPFLPLPQPLPHDTTLAVCYTTARSEAEHRVVIGRVLVRNPYIYVFRPDSLPANSPCRWTPPPACPTTPTWPDEPLARLAFAQGTRPVALMVGGLRLPVEVRAVATAPDGTTRWALRPETCRVVRLTAGQCTQPDALIQSYGTLNLTVRFPDLSLTYPLLKWEKAEYNPADNPCPPIGHPGAF